MTKNKNVLNMFIENVESYPDDSTRVSFEAVILDDSVSKNNVKVTDEALISKDLLKSVKNKPIVANIEKYGFGDHEVEFTKDTKGNDILKRNTVPIGVFTENGYITTKVIDGEERKVLMGKGVLWKSRFNEAVELLQNMWENNIPIPMSSEYLYSESSFDENGVEIHGLNSNITLEGLCVLNESVIPAYDSSTFTMLNSENISKFNMLVAQALNQDKEDKELEENTQVNEEVETPIVEEELETPEETVEVTKEGVEEKVEEETTQVNETEVALNSLQEEITKLNAKIEELTNGKADLASKLDSATETIAQLNSELEELKPIKEQMLNAEREAKLTEVKEKYAKALNAKTFESEEVQALIINSIEDGEVGVNAKLALNELVLEQFINKQEEPKSQVNSVSSKLAGLVAPKRENLAPELEDPLKNLR